MVSDVFNARQGARDLLGWSVVGYPLDPVPKKNKKKRFL